MQTRAFATCNCDHMSVDPPIRVTVSSQVAIFLDTSVELLERGHLAGKRHRDLREQIRLRRRSVAGHDLLVRDDSPLELPVLLERPSLVDRCQTDPLSQLICPGLAEPGYDLIEGGDGRLELSELTERDPLVAQRLRDGDLQLGLRRIAEPDDDLIEGPDRLLVVAEPCANVTPSARSFVAAATRCCNSVQASVEIDGSGPEKASHEPHDASLLCPGRHHA